MRRETLGSPFVLRSSVTGIVGRPFGGKSFLWTWMLAEAAKQGARSLVFTSDYPDLAAGRLKAADCPKDARGFFVDWGGPTGLQAIKDGQAWQKTLKATAKDAAPDLVIVDPIAFWIPETCRWDAGKIRRSVLEPLRNLARRSGCAVVIVADRGAPGEPETRSIADSVIDVVPTRLHGKSFYLTQHENGSVFKDPETLMYRIEGKNHGRLVWEGDVPWTRARSRSDQERSKKTRSQWNNMREWARPLLVRVYGNACARCGKQGNDDDPLHVDHIHPVSKGGTNEAANLQLLCRSCNLKKGAKV